MIIYTNIFNYLIVFEMNKETATLWEATSNLSKFYVEIEKSIEDIKDIFDIEKINNMIKQIFNNIIKQTSQEIKNSSLLNYINQSNQLYNEKFSRILENNDLAGLYILLNKISCEKNLDEQSAAVIKSISQKLESLINNIVEKEWNYILSYDTEKLRDWKLSEFLKNSIIISYILNDYYFSNIKEYEKLLKNATKNPLSLLKIIRDIEKFYRSYDMKSYCIKSKIHNFILSLCDKFWFKIVK